MKKYKLGSVSNGFTIVEILVVIVIIGILATINLVSFTGISNKAEIAAVQTDLNNAKKTLMMYQVDHGLFPESMDANNCPLDGALVVDSRYCIKSSSGTEFDYESPSPDTAFTLTGTIDNVVYSITDNSSPVAVVNNCPTGFIPVPGSATYGTADFCVMKYEAKNAGSNVPVSQESGAPWTSVSQANAISYSANVADCTGCHLITEAEWLTIAQNVLGVNANWSGGTVGNGCIFRGNSGLLDACGYDGANPESGTGRDAKASLVLTNGEVIWDFAGNVWEFTSAQTTGGQPGISGEPAFAWKQWMAVNVVGTRSPNPSPVTTGISGAGSWNSSNGIGSLYSYVSDSVQRASARGGGWTVQTDAGVLALRIDYQTTATSIYFGFRVAK